jgi:DNA polymerase-3 subunit epsilon
MPRSFPTLQPFYYLDHFHEMVGFLRRHCGALLGECEEAYLTNFQGLSRDAQGLGVRMANRRGTVFRRKALEKYAEIRDVEGCLAELTEAGFVRLAGAGDFREILAEMTRGELLDLMKRQEVRVRGMSVMSKAGVLELVEGRCVFEEGFAGSQVVRERVEELEFLRFLYFGRRGEGLQAFALRDLGIVKTRGPDGGHQVRFRDRESAWCGFFHAGLRQRLRAANAAGALEMAREIVTWPGMDEDEMGVEKGFHESIARLGGLLERQGYETEALEVFGRSDQHPARERVCRILFAKGERAAVDEMLERMIAEPSSDEELLFAEDFRARKFGKQRVGRLTAVLREALVIRVDEAFRDSAEDAAVMHFRKAGWQAWRAENHFWNTLFGVIFWDELQGGGTQNEFDARPTCLMDGSFATTRGVEIRSKLGLLGTAAVEREVRRVFATHLGEANGVFRWRRTDEVVLVEFLRNAAPAAVARILLRMAEDPARNSRGYPDLLLVRQGEVRFVEVKAEGDQIRRHQLVQMQALAEAGLPVEVVRVGWFVDPAQDYVVVDVETTGGLAARHRVTEVAAVRVRGGEVTGRFSTLVNPERPIPVEITRLTGINDAMVRGAPRFAEVADGLREFVGDAVFVAHNAAFDHGFLRAEFARSGVDFRRPTLCTVAAMRRFFPGLESYSLGKLCRHFKIPLVSHHRALCDAEATAELLKMVQRKRQELADHVRREIS